MDLEYYEELQFLEGEHNLAHEELLEPAIKQSKENIRDNQKAL